jgi:hypothetical protein
MNTVYIEPEAEAELEEAAARYEDGRSRSRTAVPCRVRQRVRDVLEAPTSFPLFGDANDVRCAHAVGRFPHLVVFMLVGDEARQMVHVLAFMHPRQRPAFWAHRRPR